MPSISASSKASTSAIGAGSDLTLITALADPSKCDNRLARRLARALNVSETLTARPTTTAKGKQKSMQFGNHVEDRKKLAMRAANAASQGLGKVVRSEWKALSPETTTGFSKESILSVVLSFRVSTAYLREVNRAAIEVERVASGFVGKLVAVQLYEPALEILDEIRTNIIQIYGDLSSVPKPKATVTRSTSKFSVAKYMYLLRYPQPAPQDSTLLALIGTSLCQALTAISGVVWLSPAGGTVLETFIATIEGNEGPLSWNSLLPSDHAEALLARVHYSLATKFSYSNTPSDLLLRLRALALRCLLRRATLDPVSFWTQATDYMASHGKSVVKSEHALKAVNDIVAFFNSITVAAKERRNAADFMSGSAFLKFCEVALIFAKRGDVTGLSNITRFINDSVPVVGDPGFPEDELSNVKIHATLSQGATMLENLGDSCTNESDVINLLSRCSEVLSKKITSSNPDFRSKVTRPMELLRRACGKVLEDPNIRSGLRDAVKSLLLTIVKAMECARSQRVHSTVKWECEFAVNIVDTLSHLAKVELLPSNAVTHMTSYEFLQRAVTLIDPHTSEESFNKEEPAALLSLAQVTRFLAGVFWISGVTLYQDGRYPAAVRFLVQACGLSVKVRNMMDSLSADDLRNESWRVLKSHIPKRWEVLGDCYCRIGERRLAYSAFLEALKSHSFDGLCHSASFLLPHQLSSDDAYRRLASLVERITFVALFDLIMEGETSLQRALCAAGVDREAVGIILEWQAASLVESSWKTEVLPVLDRILQDALDLYGPEFPIRRARVLLMQLDLAYRMDDLTMPMEQMAADLQDLLSRESNNDAALVDMQHEYMATMHIWMVFHAHRRSQGNSHSAAILHHATQASKLLRRMFPPSQVSVLVKSPKVSPRAVTAKTAKLTTRTSPRKRAAAMNVNPVTPQTQPRKVVMVTPPNPRKHGASPTKALTSSTNDHFVASIQMVAQLMGLLGHVVLKIKFLNVLQRMTEQSAAQSADDFVRASVDAANEYVRLGKIRRAMAIYSHALSTVNCATAAAVSDEVRVNLLLHYAACHALNGNVEKSSCLYKQAYDLSHDIEVREDNSTLARIRARVLALERSALASNVFAAIQVAQDDPHAAFSTLRKSLRLWNRAVDALSRLCQPPAPALSDPFDLTSLAETLPPLPRPQQPNLPSKGRFHRNAVMGDVQWRIAEGLLHTLFALGQAYFLQGTVRGAEFYIEQARDLAQSLNSPALLSRALAKKGELQLHQGKLEDAATTLLQASELLDDFRGIDAADVKRLRAHHSQLMDKNKEAKALYLEIVTMLSDLEESLSPVEKSDPTPRRSSPTRSPDKSSRHDILVPGFLAAILRQQIWLQRHEPQSETKALLDRISSLPPSRETKAEELAIAAKLALHEAHELFRADLFLSSLTESIIALPMGTPNHDAKLSPSTRQMLGTLSTAEEMFWACLEMMSNRGQASDVREAAMSLVLIQSFQTSLGKSWTTGARVVAGLLDASAAITLRRELIDEIDHKFTDFGVNDLAWSTFDGQSCMAARTSPWTRSISPSEDSDENPTIDLKAYWGAVRERYYASYVLNDHVRKSQVDILPAHWTVVSITISDDKSTMFFSRQRCGREPLIFCVPLERHGRKEEDRAEQFTYWNAVGQLRDILRESDVSAEEGQDVSPQNRDAKVAWWAKRAALDKRMRELLENIEFCWLGAFKTILGEPFEMHPNVLNSFRVRLENVFKRNLTSDKKRMSRVKLDDAIMECFASLSPKCPDEELEDLVYFVLDLYQFHGVHVALSEVDMEQLTVELRTELEEHASKAKTRIVPMNDAHLFLVLDKNVQGIPWESIPVLRGRSVSRIPSLSFLVDRMELAKLQRESVGSPVVPLDRVMVNPKKTYFVLNPSGDLSKSQARFGAWVKEMESTVGWQGIVGQVPSEQELLDALSRKDLVIYFGHGGGEQYVRSYKIKQLQRCAATMLWGCSSGLLREMGDFDRIGTPYNYMLAGCPTLVGCLWDVTDNELDKISRSVFDKLRLDPAHVQAWRPELMDEAPMSIVAAVGQSRDVCKLKYLTGAAPVVYGIPFYL